MNIRITDLLDDYLDQDLPLDPIPDLLPKQQPKKPQRPGRRKHWGQIIAAVLIVASITTVGGFKLLCGGSTGKSLAAQPAGEGEQDASKEQAAAPTPEPTAEAAAELTPEPSDGVILEDGGYYNSTITVEGEDVNVSAGNLIRSGNTFTLTVTVDTQLENVAGFLLGDYQVYLVLRDGTTAEPTAVSETTYLENPFVRDEAYTFDDVTDETELEAATLYLQIQSVTLMRNDSVENYIGSWNMGFSLAGVNVPASASGEGYDGETIPEGQDFSITDLQVSESGCTFWLHTPSERYMLVPQGQLALAQQQGGGETYYGFSLLTGGSAGVVTVDSTTMSNRGVTDSQNLVYCTVTWKERINPTEITGLYFTDGTTSLTAEVTVYTY